MTEDKPVPTISGSSDYSRGTLLLGDSLPWKAEPDTIVGWRLTWDLVKGCTEQTPVYAKDFYAPARSADFQAPRADTDQD